MAQSACGVDSRSDRCGLVLGGAAGNLADRVFRSPGPLHGAVVDFVAIGWGPIFNAADVCVMIGVAILTSRLLAENRSPAPALYWQHLRLLYIC
jgi:lipoprotein signal peptidase